MKYLKAEALKFKNSFSMYVLFLSPLVFLCFSIFTAVFAKSNSLTPNGLSPYITLLFNLWPIAFIPIVVCLACYSLIMIETRNKMFNFYLSNNWDLTKEIKAKIFIISFAFLIHGLMMYIVALVGDFLISPSPIKPSLLLATILIIFWVAIPLIPLNFLLLRYLGIFLTIFVNLVLSIFSIIFLTLKSVFWLSPWAIMQKIPLITLGILPNGLTVDKYSKYFNDLESLYISIIVSIVTYIIFTILNTKKSWRL
ncbi:lantibiotic immunity ABC transporter MutE/EpiE family permease subunit (plasmid) [Staphylococcus agnetis]|uniref:HyiE n=1 Tax=Staphylococcus hyicus TaxID=1284 RepID=A0A1V0JZE1_STAHY|nr:MULTISPECIES: lantibiotic immunity ABC transporter MutE/EpiE family permease subunit [Staphylococcus]ARD24451.1 HyiE [Staphylococcus hyicus]NHM74036.1 lantibiotic immunity ABC transporter MutE/EpiE family permease subunit [Staphylococcus sp. 11007852]TRW80370.1 lantibiotic immunity ABC transporter MutE/EpiE family permease subunit [Staphylococcus agnetis]